MVNNEQKALIVCQQLTSFVSMMNDGPDDSDEAMAQGWLNSAIRLAREVIESSGLQDSQLLAMTRFDPDRDNDFPLPNSD